MTKDYNPQCDAQAGPLAELEFEANVSKAGKPVPISQGATVLTFAAPSGGMPYDRVAAPLGSPLAINGPYPMECNVGAFVLGNRLPPSQGNVATGATTYPVPNAPVPSMVGAVIEYGAGSSLAKVEIDATVGCALALGGRSFKVDLFNEDTRFDVDEQATAYISYGGTSLRAVRTIDALITWNIRTAALGDQFGVTTILADLAAVDPNMAAVAASIHGAAFPDIV